MPRTSSPYLAATNDTSTECPDESNSRIPINGPELAALIRTRIESRLAGRIRNLDVRVRNEVVVLQGRCATYHTKQLAQHAALGVIEDEQLENEIQVTVPK